jgi:Holliday junction DNA helicase RuvA
VGDVAAVSPGAVGDEVALWIYTYVREDQITLFGFKEALQKKMFLVLLGITGIGPKLAMAVVSFLAPEELVEAVTLGNLRVLQSVPGVGKKMANRMILELKDKLASLVITGVLAGTGQKGTDLATWQDMSEALSGLGFSEQQIRNVIKLLRTEFGEQTPEINELLKVALQKIKNC